MSNAFLKDPNLSLPAKGLLAVIMTNREDWKVYPVELAKRLNISRNSVDKYLKELEEHGYLLTYRKGSGRSRGIEIHRFFSDYPMSDFYKELLLETNFK